MHSDFIMSQIPKVKMQTDSADYAISTARDNSRRKGVAVIGNVGGLAQPETILQLVLEAMLQRRAQRMQTKRLTENVRMDRDVADQRLFRALHDHLVEQGVHIEFPPKDGPFGRYFAFSDPFGYSITVHTVAKPD